jgi:uncharacterized protein with HEPN domain
MIDCVDHILADTESRREVFFGSRTIRDAVLRNLQTLTESSQRLSDQAKAAEPGIPWRQMSATRNILVHDYLGGIDPETVWTIVERDLPLLRAALQRLIAGVQANDSSKDDQ